MGHIKDSRTDNSGQNRIEKQVHDNLRVDLLFFRPVFTVPELSNALGVNCPTAPPYVNHLEESEILREITGQVRNRVHQADGILHALEESFS